MQIAATLIKELNRHGIEYEVIPHRYAHSSLHAAHSAHIPEQKMVKPVVLEDDRGYVMALLPANQYLRLEQLNAILNRDMDLAQESELADMFRDCDLGAIPPIGEAYGMKTIVDYDLDDCHDVYIESGNHTDLLHISASGFSKLVGHSRHANIGMH